MSSAIFLTRVRLRNYKSIGNCDVRLGPLTYLVGANGSGKSNFLEALHLVRDALASSLDIALNERGGLAEVRRRSGGHPNHFGIRLDFVLRDGRPGLYAFDVGSGPEGAHFVKSEKLALGQKGQGPRYTVEGGVLKESSEAHFPALTQDRLALVSLSGLQAFRPVFDALTSMGFYNLNPKVMREPQKPQDGRLLKPVGENIASVIGHLERTSAEGVELIRDYLQSVVPSIDSFRRKSIGPLETLEFRQRVAGQRHAWSFSAQNMSDGTLRTLGVLVALFQGNPDHSPSLIGIEEPETALHPAAARALRGALARASLRTQVIVTSHSPDLLDDGAVQADAIRAVVADDGDTRIAELDAAAAEAMREQLFSAGELLRLDQLAPDPASLRQQARQVSLFDELEAD